MPQSQIPQLVGMFDSPYTRRVAVTAQLLGIPYAHRPWSVFGDYDRIAALNPAVKVPMLVLPDRTVLTESGGIIEHLEEQAACSLLPVDPRQRLISRVLTGLGLTICEKTLQIVYERELRPSEKQYGPWIERVTRQLHGALGEAERQIPPSDHWLFETSQPTHADVILAVAWRQATSMVDTFDRTAYPGLAALSRLAESDAAFVSAPFPA